MATIGTDLNGRHRVLFVANDGKRKTVRLGSIPLRRAEAIKGHIEELASAKASGNALGKPTAEWLRGISNALHDRLVRVGLAETRQAVASVKLGAFIDEYLAQRPDVKPGTMLVFKQAKRHLVAFLGEGKAIDTTTPADADAYRADLLGKGRAKATTAKWLQYARHFFEVAKRRRIIAENPFAHIKGGVRGNSARRVFVPAADVQKVIDAAPDPQWKLLIALARFGGLRTPSEALTLTWNDVDWEHGRFTVHASKTEHHRGGGIRVVPVFPELLPHLLKVFDAAEPGTVSVITRYRDPAANLRTQLIRYITAAGLTPWAKPWQNLRSSRATELADSFPSHVCAAWLGHTEAVADEFYRQTTDEHFQRAIGGTEKAARQTAQSPHVSPRQAVQPPDATPQNTPELQGVTKQDEKGPIILMGAAGFEPATERL